MVGSIYLVQDGGELAEMTARSYDLEKELQDLVEKYPKLLAGDQMESAAPRRWLMISREAGVPVEEGGSDRWAVDHLFIDQDGIPTLVEVKRSSDTRIRREVVGQMLDYAANAVVYWPAEKMRATFEARLEAEDGDSREVLAEALGDHIDEDEFWNQVKTNLRAGKVRLLFVADEIPTELQRIVEFLNGQMDPAEVLAVEIKRFVGEGLTTLVPQVVGQTAEAKQPSRDGRQWDEASFFSELEANDAELVEPARAIMEWALGHGLSIRWGQGSVYGSCAPFLNHNGTRYPLVTIWTNKYFDFQFESLRTKPPFDDEGTRADLLRAVPTINLSQGAMTGRPGVPLSAVAQDGPREQLFEALAWAVDQIKAT